MGTARDYSNTTRQSAPAAILAAALCVPAWGGVTIHVDSDAPAGGDGMSWRNPLIDLQAALDMSLRFKGQAVEIRLGAGTYVPTARTDETDPRSATFKLVDGAAILGGFAGFGAPDPDARDIQKLQTILSGDLAGDDGPPGSFTNIADNAYHVVTAIDIVDETTALDGLTITAGNACCIDDQFDSRVHGGGLYATNAALMLIECTLEYNSGRWGGGAHFKNTEPALVGCILRHNRGIAPQSFSTTEGGGAYFEFSNPVMTNCSFTDNTAKQGGGTIHRHGSTVIDGCVFNANVAEEWYGGGMYAISETLSIEGSSFDGNTAVYFAGAAFISSSQTTIRASEFTNNVSESAGAIWSSGPLLAITDSTFVGNHATDFDAGAIRSAAMTFSLIGCHLEDNACTTYGGAAHIRSPASAPACVEIIGCTFVDNFASTILGVGGGLRLHEVEGSLQTCVFESNSCDDGGGAHVTLLAGRRFAIADCRFLDNSAWGWGGGLWLGGGEPHLERCELRGNLAQEGGGLMAGGSSPTIVNCLFANNAASLNFGGTGGAILSWTSSPNLVNCTFAGNFANSGSAIRAALDSQCNFGNCIIWNNGSNPFSIQGTSVISIERSDVQGGWNGPGGWNIDADPLFIDPAAGDYRLAQGSPCIDAADNDALPLDSITDLDGLPRFVDDQTAQNTGQGEGPLADMGAYERQVAPGFCPADCAQPVDNAVDVLDVLAVIETWGASRGPTDINGDGTVNVLDLLLVISAWGECP